MKDSRYTGKYTFPEDKCPTCGKSFIRAPQHVYKRVTNSKSYYFCSYTCYRTDQRKEEYKKTQKKKAKRKEDI